MLNLCILNDVMSKKSNLFRSLKYYIIHAKLTPVLNNVLHRLFTPDIQNLR